MVETKIIKGIPEEVKQKRILRIKEAINFPLGTKENPTKNVIDNVNGVDAYFKKPGKEFFREGTKKNANDMTPEVKGYGHLNFSEIWKQLLDLSVHLSSESYKKLFVIIYRLAYMLDCDIINGKVRFNPTKDIMQEINLIQREIDINGSKIKILELLYYLDLIAWNEDVKYQSDMKFQNPKKGRINNLLSMISVPLIFKNFVDNLLNNKNHLDKIDYTSLIDIAQDFSRMRGVSPISNKALAEYLSPYLVTE